MDDISAGFVSGLNDELTEEEKRSHWASLGNIAHRYPLKPGFWDKMEDLSIEGAALYSFGIAPDAIALEMEVQEHNDLGTLPADYTQRLAIIKSAVRVGSIKRAPLNGSDPGGWDDSTRIVKDSFLEWCEKNPDTCVLAEKLPTYPQYQPKEESEDTAKADQVGEESNHDPLPLDGIASIFKVDLDDEKNIQQWKTFAHNAMRNGLSVARTQKIGGKGQSRFDPAKVGDWLVSKGKLSPEKMERILLNNLPPRNAHLKDLAAL